MRTHGTLALACSILAALGSPAGFCPVARAGLVYSVSIDTSGLAPATTGYIDVQFNPFNATSAPATASLTQFALGGGSLLDPPSVTGDVTGALPGALVLGNSTPYNDYFQHAAFGNGITFLLTLDGPAFSTISIFGSSFSVSLYQDDQTTPLAGGTDPYTVIVDLVPDGVNPGVLPVVTVAPAYADGPLPEVILRYDNAVPEPSTLALIALGWMGCLLAGAAKPGRATQR